MGLDYYYIKPSPPCRAGLMVAKEIGVELNLHVVDILKGEQHKEEYLKKNPAHTVPMLVDGDLVISDSHAIMTYLVDVYSPGHKLYPSDRKVRAQIDCFLFLDCGTIFPDLLTIFYTIVGGTKPSEDMYEQWKNNRLSVLEAYLQGKNYLVGENKTIADLSLYATVQFAQIVLNIDISKFPSVIAWMNRIKAELPYDEEINQKPSIHRRGIMEAKLKELS